MRKKEENIIIAINAAKKIMMIFLGPFLTAYFIKTSAESVTYLSIYNIFCYFLLGVGSFFVASIIKNKFKIGMFRIGVITNFIYIMTIVLLKEKIIEYLWLISILYGISSSSYWFPYNMFVINKVNNKNRTEYTVKSKNISSAIGIICPILLGSMITVTNYQLTAMVILVISLIQIILSFILTPIEDSKLSKFNLRKTWNNIKENKQVRKMFLVEYFIGMSISDGALQIVMTILIFNAFKTDMNLGIVSSIATILSMMAVYIYGKVYKNRNDSKIIIISSIIPVLSLLLLLLRTNNITVIVYNFCYVIFVGILSLTREIRLYNLSDSSIIDKENQAEFFSIREAILNCGRVTGYTLLLIAGMIGSTYAFNIVMIILTMSILLMGLNIKRIEKFEE